MTHDQLQSKTFQWAHNTFPIIRGQLFAVQNEVAPHPNESRIFHMKRISHYKSIGLLPGALDLLLIMPGATYGFDAKVGKDVLSEKQRIFIKMLEKMGGGGWVYRSEHEFQVLFCSLMQKHYGTHAQTNEILRGIFAGW